MAFTCYLVILCSFLYADLVSVGHSISLVNSEGEHLPDSNSSADIPKVVDEPVCNLCRGQCQVEDYPGCKCDAMCELYDDCCVDSPQCEPFAGYPNVGDHLFALMECNTHYHDLFLSAYLEGYWMVSRCSEWFDFDKVVDFQCATASVAPVSDQETGIIYKNEYCAICNSANSTIRWPFTYTCREDFRHLLNFQSVDVDSFLENCSPCRYVIPISLYNNSDSSVHLPRTCVMHVSTCLMYMDYMWRVDEDSLLSMEEFENAVYYCKNGPYSLIIALVISDGESKWTLYKNAHCALCNGADIYAADSGNCVEFSNLDQCFFQQSASYGTPRPTFSLLLDINRDGATTISAMETVTSTTALQIACNENEVFDPAAVMCREIICPPSYMVINGRCVQTLRNSGLMRSFGLGDIGSVSSNPNQIDIPANESSASTLQELSDVGHVLVTTFPSDDSMVTPPCSLVTLVKGRDDFTVGNDSVIFEGTLFTVVTFDDFQNPVICTSPYSFNDSSLLTYHQRIKQIVPSLFIIPSLIVHVIVLSLQSLLRTLHSMYGIVIISLAFAMISSDIFLWSTFSSTSSLGSFYFLWHASSLAIASWLCVLIVHISLSFRKRCIHPTLNVSFGQKATLVCLYFTFGWGVPLLAALINNEVYGPWYPCINDSFSFCGPITSILSFIVVPVTIATVFCLLICVSISIKSIISSESLDKQILCRLCCFMILVFVFAPKWIFGFVYFLSPSLLTSTISFLAFFLLKLVCVLVFFFGFVFTKRLRHTFRQSVFNCCHQRNGVQPLAQNL